MAKVLAVATASLRRHIKTLALDPVLRLKLLRRCQVVVHQREACAAATAESRLHPEDVDTVHVADLVGRRKLLTQGLLANVPGAGVNHLQHALLARKQRVADELLSSDRELPFRHCTTV